MTSGNPGTSQTFHGTAVQIFGYGVLLRGASGSGKSSLAMRLLDECILAGLSGFLVADDRVIFEECDEGLSISGPENLRGLIEVRGVGIIQVEHVARTRLDLIVDLVPETRFERYPDRTTLTIGARNSSIAHIEIIERNPDAGAIIRTFLRTQMKPSATRLVEI